MFFCRAQILEIRDTDSTSEVDVGGVGTDNNDKNGADRATFLLAFLSLTSQQVRPCRTLRSDAENDLVILGEGAHYMEIVPANFSAGSFPVCDRLLCPY